MKIEIRSKNQATIEGYVNVVGRESRTLKREFGKFIETVKPGTFQKAINEGNNIELRLNHQQKLGDTKSGTLELKEDAIGLYAKAHVSDEAVIEKARRNELRGWSFGFRKKSDHWEEGEDGIKRRTLEEIHLTDVSIVDKTPAYIATTIEMRDGEAEVLEFRVCGEGFEVIETKPDKGVANQKDLSFFYREQEVEILKTGGIFYEF